MFFDTDWTGGKKCKFVSWQTQYSSVARDDYKRCVCETLGDGASDCPDGEIDTSNQSVLEPETEDEQEQEEPETEGEQEQEEPETEDEQELDEGKDDVVPEPDASMALMASS